MKSKALLLSILLVPLIIFVPRFAGAQVLNSSNLNDTTYSAFDSGTATNCTTNGTTIYCPLAPLSSAEAGGINTSGSGAFAQYINDIYTVAITVAAVLAVIMITIGGIEYMGSEAFSSKEEGKKKIWNALTGLILLLACYLILNTINPQLLNLNISIQPDNSTGVSTGGGAGNVGGAGTTGAAATIATSQSVLQNMVTSSNSTLTSDQSTLQQMQAANPSNPNIAVMQNKVASDQIIAANTQENYNLLYGNSSPSSSQSSSQSGTTITPTLTAYSPQSSNANGNLAMEGGLSTYSPGPDGKTDVQTLDDYVNGTSAYVTVAGDKSEIGQKYIIPSITYTNSSGVTQTLTNVPVVVTDTGSAFNGAGTSHFDIPVGVNYTTSELNKQPFSGETATFESSPPTSNNVTGTITDENENYVTLAQDNLSQDQAALNAANSAADPDPATIATLTAKVADDQSVVSALQGNSQLATADAAVVQDQINLIDAEDTGASQADIDALNAQLSSDNANDAAAQNTSLLNFDTSLAQDDQSAIAAMQGINPDDTALESLGAEESTAQSDADSADSVVQNYEDDENLIYGDSGDDTSQDLYGDAGDGDYSLGDGNLDDTTGTGNSTDNTDVTDYSVDDSSLNLDTSGSGDSSGDSSWASF